VSFSGERLLIAATVEPVEVDELFKKLPLHMTITRPFVMPESQQKRFLLPAMGNLFDGKEVYQDAVGGKKLRYGVEENVPAREVLNIKNPEWIALNALVRSMDGFPELEEDPFIHTFSPHISDRITETVIRGKKVENREMIHKQQELAFRAVTLFAQEPGDEMQYVKAVYNLATKESPRG